uniref:Uncharacterized protein n=1 Tax=Anopheles merus TaxID=30066 RepID=A0A182VCZ3_ANOME
MCLFLQHAPFEAKVIVRRVHHLADVSISFAWMRVISMSAGWPMSAESRNGTPCTALPATFSSLRCRTGTGLPTASPPAPPGGSGTAGYRALPAAGPPGVPPGASVSSAGWAGPPPRRSIKMKSSAAGGCWWWAAEPAPGIGSVGTCL